MNSTDGSPKNAAWVPLPWWTSMSTMAMRERPSARSAAAAIAMLL